MERWSLSHARLTAAVLVLAPLLAAGEPFRAQQSNSSNNTPAADKQNQSQTGSDSSAQPPAGQQPSDDNAFPEAESEKAAKQAEQQKKNAAPQSPASAADGKQQDSTDGSGGDNNTFPEETSRKAAEAKARDADSNASSSSGVSSSDDYDTKVNGRRVITPNVAMPHVGSKDPLKEDVQVGTYYLQSGDYPGAYSRFKEATELHPESTDAIFGLAEAARHLHKNDEALENYKLFLDIVPSGSKAKDARKALASLGSPH